MKKDNKWNGCENFRWEFSGGEEDFPAGSLVGENFPRENFPRTYLLTCQSWDISVMISFISHFRSVNKTRRGGGGVGITMRMLLVCFSKKNLVACGGMYSKIEISPSLELLELRNIYLHIFGLFHFVSIYWESILVLSGIEKLLRCWGERMLF